MKHNSRYASRNHSFHYLAGFAIVLSVGGCTVDATDNNTGNGGDRNVQTGGKTGRNQTVQNGGNTSTNAQVTGGLTSSGGDTGSTTLASSGGTMQASTGGAAPVGTGGNTAISTGGAAPVNTGGNTAIATGGAAQMSTGGATLVSTAGAAQVSTGGAAPIATGGAAQVNTGGATEESTGGAAPVSTGGATQESTGGAAPVSTGGATQESTGGAAPVSTGGAAQVSTGGATQESTGGAAQVSTGGTAQENTGGATQLSTGGTTQVGSTAPDESLCFDELGTAVPYYSSIGLMAEYASALSMSCDVGGYLTPLVMADPELLTQVEAFITDATDWYRADILNCQGATTQLSQDSYGLLPVSQSSDLSGADFDASLSLFFAVLDNHDGQPDGVSGDKKAEIKNRITSIKARAVQGVTAGLTKTLTEPDCVRSAGDGG